LQLEDELIPWVLEPKDDVDSEREDIDDEEAEEFWWGFEPSGEEVLIDELMWLTSDFFESADRVNAIQSLGEIASSSSFVIEEIYDLTFDKSDAVRHAAVFALGNTGEAASSQHVVDRLLELAVEKVNPFRTETSKKAEVREAYQEYMKENESISLLRRTAMESLGNLGDLNADLQTIRILLSLTDDTDVVVVHEELRCLSHMGPAVGTEEVKNRLATLRASEDEVVRNVAMEIRQNIERTPNKGFQNELLTVAYESHAEQGDPAWVLAWMGEADVTAETIDRLLSLTADDDVNLRYAAVQALGEMGNKAATTEVVERLLALTTDKEPRVRYATASTLAAFAGLVTSPLILERLLSLTSDVDPRVRQMALQGVGEMGELAAIPEALEAVLPLIRDTNPDICAEAVWVMGEIGKTIASRYLVEQLVSLVNNNDSEVRASLAVALGSIGAMFPIRSLIETLVRLTNDKDDKVRLATAKAFTHIGKIVPEKILPVLIKLAGDRNVDVLCEALNAIAEIGENIERPEIIDDLCRLTFNESSRVRATASITLGSVLSTSGSSIVLEHLIKLCRDSDEEVRYSAALALGRADHTRLGAEVLECLMELTVESSERVRIAAAMALGRIESVISKADALERLVTIWGDRLDSKELEYASSGGYRRVCDIAYEELSIIASKYASM
jgi:HEAT repeat protein